MSRRTALAAVVLLASLAVVLTYVFPFRQIIAQRRAVELSEQKLEVLREENDRLQGEADRLHTDLEVERIAREQFGLVRPGEVAYVVVSPPDEFESRREAEEPVDPEPPQEDARRWWHPLWDFLTGRDLIPDDVAVP